jgi:outer membrane immunogenic protein
VPAPVYNWTGFWISGGVGYALADVNTSVTSATFPLTVFDSGHDLGARGWLGKVGAGYDYQFSGFLGSWVIGVFADGSWSDIKGQDSFLCPAVGCNSFAFGFAGQQQNDWSWAVGARIGYVVTPTLLTYFNGGWTESHWKQVNWFGNDPGNVGFGTFSGLVLPSQTRNGMSLARTHIYEQAATTELVYRFNWTGPGMGRY